MYGTEFESKIEPFAIYRFFLSFGITIIIMISSLVNEIGRYRMFFIFCCLVSAVAELIILTKFDLTNKKSLRN